MKINEWLSVNNDVINLTKEIGKRIIALSSNSERMIGKYSGIPFSEGSFSLDTKTDIGKITVCYMMFHCDNTYAYDVLYADSALNCVADSDNNTVLIHSAFINGKVADDFIESIAHEVNHIYQYANGFHKNVDLYDAVVDTLNRYSMNNLSSFTAMLVYYTFKHEVDSFATQFYHFLKSGNYENCDFKQAANKFKYYKDVHYMYDTVFKDINNQYVISTIQRLGLTKKQWKHRVQSGIKRFDSKLMNVYRRYRIEAIRESSVETIIRRHAFLTEKYGHLEEIIEPIYQLVEII